MMGCSVTVAPSEHWYVKALDVRTEVVVAKAKMAITCNHNVKHNYRAAIIT